MRFAGSFAWSMIAGASLELACNRAPAPDSGAPATSVSATPSSLASTLGAGESGAGQAPGRERSDSPPPAARVVGAGEPCGATLTGGTLCGEGLECFETSAGNGVGICAEPAGLESLLQLGHECDTSVPCARRQDRWVGLRDVTVADTGFLCVRERPSHCSALLVAKASRTAHLGSGKVFLMRQVAHLKCTRRATDDGRTTERCDVKRGEYALVVGHLVSAGYRWAKLDVAAFTRAKVDGLEL